MDGCMNDIQNERELLHIDLIRRVSADHVQHGETATRMFVKPSVQSQDSALGNDNGIAAGNLRLDLASTEDSIPIHCWWR